MTSCITRRKHIHRGCPQARADVMHYVPRASLVSTGRWERTSHAEDHRVWERRRRPFLLFVVAVVVVVFCFFIISFFGRGKGHDKLWRMVISTSSYQIYFLADFVNLNWFLKISLPGYYNILFTCRFKIGPFLLTRTTWKPKENTCIFCNQIDFMEEQILANMGWSPDLYHDRLLYRHSITRFE